MFRGISLIGALVLVPLTASAQQPCTADARRVVAEVYQRVLERGYDSRGDNLVTQLSSGQTTVREIVRAVARLPEHNQRFLAGDRQAAVTALYRHILGRDPDPVGLQDHINGANNKGIGAVLEAMISSAEYAEKSGDYGVPGSSVRYCGPGQSSQSSQPTRGNRNGRFANMDSNGNGVIERGEWTGTREAFVVNDWNGDDQLSGEEVRTGARRAANAVSPAFNSWTEATFTNLDRNRDGRLSAAEWQFDTESFVNADRNRDGNLARAEFMANGAAPAASANMDDNRFDSLDRNRNGRIERGEWQSSADAFGWLDRNGDNVLSRQEVVGNSGAADQFASFDTNDDGRLTIEEYNGTRRSFNQQDTNGDGWLSRREFASGGAVPTTGR